MQQQKGILRMVNYSGQKIYSIELKPVKGTNDFDLQLPTSILPGIYLVTFTTNNTMVNKQLVIK